MMTRRMVFLNCLGIGSILVDGQAVAAPNRSRAMALLDSDNDGTVDLDEAKKEASALFDKLDRDHDGTLDKAELRGRLSAAEFATADPDKDGTLSKVEYLKVVENRFKAADADNDRPWMKRNCVRRPAGNCSCCCNDLIPFLHQSEL